MSGSLEPTLTDQVDFDREGYQGQFGQLRIRLVQQRQPTPAPSHPCPPRTHHLLHRKFCSVMDSSCVEYAGCIKRRITNVWQRYWQYTWFFSPHFYYVLVASWRFQDLTLVRQPYDVDDGSQCLDGKKQQRSLYFPMLLLDSGTNNIGVKDMKSYLWLTWSNSLPTHCSPTL